MNWTVVLRVISKALGDCLRNVIIGGTISWAGFFIGKTPSVASSGGLGLPTHWLAYLMQGLGFTMVVLALVALLYDLIDLVHFPEEATILRHVVVIVLTCIAVVLFADVGYQVWFLVAKSLLR